MRGYSARGVCARIKRGLIVMLGRTHAMNALALAHVGYVGYMKYLETGGTVGQDMLASLGLPTTEPLSVLEYTLVSLITFMFVLWFLRIGRPRMRRGFLGIFVFAYLALWSFSGTTAPLVLATAMLCYVLGSLLPDIDSEGSTIGRYIKPIARTIPHRTITHTLWFILVFAIISWFTTSIYLWAMTLGIIIHIIQDSFSRQGIAWLYPVVGGYRQYGYATVKKGRNPSFGYAVGGVFEDIIFYASLVINIGLVFYVTMFYYGF